MNRRDFLRQFVASGIIPLLPISLDRLSEIQITPKSDMIIFNKVISDTIYKVKKMQWVLDSRPKTVDYYRVLLSELGENRVTWMDEGISDSADRYVFLGGPMVDPNLREVEISNDLYIIVGEDYLDIHSKQLDTEQEPGVLIDVSEELDELIAKLIELRKELEEEY